MLILSVRPHYADKMFKGTKTVELRRIYPKIRKDDLVLIYITSPIRALAGAFKVDEILAKSPSDLWRIVQKRAAITQEEFNDYYAGASKGVAICFRKIWKLSEPIKLEELKKRWPGFHPPRVFCYLNGNRDKQIIFRKLIKE